MAHNQFDSNVTASMDNSMPTTVLLVDDVAEIRFVARAYFENFGFIVQLASRADEALARFDPNLIDVVVTDNSMPGMTGEEMAHIIKMRSAATPVIMYTGLQPEDGSILDAIVLKPAPLAELKVVIENVLAQRNSNRRHEVRLACGGVQQAPRNYLASSL